MPTLEEISDDLYRAVMQQRETILRAFIAETGCKPSDAIQVQDGLRWYVRKKDEADLKREALATKQRWQDFAASGGVT